ncbi:periculin 3 precursor [Hydra vulgaris]|uniref:Periculin 3 n=1 Tax=Hydra vulgaris TaxID=6087 RepID=C1JCM4_HYDVU|nr:periculin 3 precursor [Hydra vulgaris]ACO55945.1 periculin 3 [Hydra vulgaris]
MFMKIILIFSVILAATADEFLEFEDQYESSDTIPSNFDNENQFETKIDYFPKSEYKPKKIFCLGVDVTKKCLERADGNYAIDSKTKPGYVACVDMNPICMPCPYGMVFCDKTGNKGLGQCLRQCPPRSY